MTGRASYVGGAVMRKGRREYLPAAQPGSKFIRSQTLLSPGVPSLAAAHACCEV